MRSDITIRAELGRAVLFLGWLLPAVLLSRQVAAQPVGRTQEPRLGAVLRPPPRCPPLRTCAIACPDGLAHDAQGCTQCACSPSPGLLLPRPHPHSGWQAAQAEVIGSWAWFNRVTVLLQPDSTAVGSNGELGTWRVANPQTRQYVISWRAGWIDTVTLSPDGSTLQGWNQHGTRVFGHRRGGAVTTGAGGDRASLLGAFEGVHPHWRDVVILSADGTYRRATGDAGRWTFDGTTLTLSWEHWGPEFLQLRGPGFFVADRNGFTLRKLH